MVTAGVNFAKIKENREMRYLTDWYCPLEKNGGKLSNPISSVGIANLPLFINKIAAVLNSILIKKGV